MNKTLYIIAIAIIAVAVAGGIYLYMSPKEQPPAPGPVMCTMEAKLCPDGSYVGRTGPKCEFTPCPTATATSTPGNGILPYKSGIQGIITLGPTCPVQQNPPDPTCADQPYKTLITVFRSVDLVHAMAFTNSDANGIFKISLPPGDYTLGAGESMLPRCNNTKVTVGPDSYVSVTISCDTGIR